MAENVRQGESSSSAQASTSNGATKDHRSEQIEAKRRQRQDLQLQCLQPSGLPSQSRTGAWLALLDISDEAIHQRAKQLKERKPAKENAKSSKEKAASPVPLDKDGWQVASEDILDGNSSKGRNQNEDEWKVVKSKRTKRRKNIGSPLDSPPLDRSPQSTTSTQSSPTTSPKPDTSPARFEEEAKQSRADLPLFPNLSARDIEQVAKDVDRSFIGPPFTFLSSTHRTFRRRQLTRLILTTLSAHPSLHYFQGYHDILSVALLTLAPQLPPSSSTALFMDDHERATLELICERISLHLIRDNMTRDLLPVLGQLKVLGKLLRVADKDMAELAERASPMPFFALPWLLTLLTHDMEEVEVGRRVMEWIIAYGPRAGIYLCAAVLHARREEVLAMDPDELEDPAMLHTILGRLPSIVEDKTEEESKNEPADGKEEKAEEANEIYTDPDVELPSLASDRALAAATPEAGTGRRKESIPISSLLTQAVELMDRYPFDSGDLAADTILGRKSVLHTWPNLFTSPSVELDWAEQDASAENILKGSTDAIVISPHPDPPTAPPEMEDEKFTPLSPRRKQEWEQARVLAVVSISGLLIAALFASQNPASSAARVADIGSEETKRVLTLIVSLLSNFGRVVGPGGG